MREVRTAQRGGGGLWRLVCMLAVVLGAASCSEAPTPAPVPETAALLPAYETEREQRTAAKGDEQSDWRLAHPEWYAITVPPASPVRAMVEWEPMSMLLTAWPDYLGTDKGARQTVVAMLGHTVTAADTDVGVVVETNAGAQKVLSLLLEWGLTEQQLADRVHIWQVPLDSVWFIDFGPLPVVDEALGRVGLVDFRYFKSRTLDDAVPSRMALAGGANGGPALPATVWRAPFNFEGGNFQGDGEGGCYTTTRALKNTGATQKEVEQVLSDYVGCARVVVLEDLSDDATGHIDMLFKLARRDVAIVGSFDGEVVVDEANQARMDANAALLAGLVVGDEAPMQVLRMPFPAKKGTVPRTFLNATLVNGVNLWPVYKEDGAGGALEAEAAAVWEQALPGWAHVPILSDRLAELSGAIHCVSRTLPAYEVAPIVEAGACVDGACAAGADGFDGPCQTDDACRGPQWECACPICNTSCGEAPCGNIPDLGVCVGQAVLTCVAGAVETEECAGCCAVDAASGVAACAATCDGCGGCEAGETGCAGNHAWRCDVADDCARRVYEACDGGCKGGACNGCAGLDAVGCCESATVAKACTAAGVSELSCGKGWTCGWEALGGFYACVPEDQALLEDPSGEHAIACGGQCVHACAAGAEGCTPDGGAAWRCVEDEAGCRTVQRTPCEGGMSCAGAQCVAAGEEPGDPEPTGGEAATGCAARTTGSADLPAALGLSALMAAAIAVRLRHRRRLQATG